jgi:hypothetical protein
VAAPITDQELDAWIADAWPDRSAPPWSREACRRYLQDDRDAEERLQARRAAHAARQAKAAEATELPALRAQNADFAKRVKRLEMLVGWPKPEKGVLMEALGEALRVICQDFEQKIAAVRDQQLEFGDIFQPGKSYLPSTLVVHKGSLWISLTTTVDPPGSSTSWQLVTKQGAFDRPRAV